MLIESDALIKFTIGFVNLEANVIAIEVDKNKNIDELDFEIPVINSRYSRDYLSLDLLNPNNFDFVAVNLKKYDEDERNKNIIFRDLFVTGLRMAMEQKGKTMVTSIIAKLKTSAQMIIITFILLILGLKGLSLTWAVPILDIVKDYKLVYNLSLFVTLFTGFTGLTYLFSNRKTRRTGGGGFLFSSLLLVLNSIGLIILFLWFFNTSGNQQEAGQNFVERISILEERLAAKDEQISILTEEVDADLKFVNKEVRKLWDLSNKRNRKNISENLNSIESVQKLLQEYSQNIKLIAGDTNKVLIEIDLQKIDFVFLDGGHSYETVTNDLMILYGGMKDQKKVILCDDYGKESYIAEVEKAIDDFTKKNNLKFNLIENRFAEIIT